MDQILIEVNLGHRVDQAAAEVQVKTPMVKPELQTLEAVARQDLMHQTLNLLIIETVETAERVWLFFNVLQQMDQKLQLHQDQILKAQHLVEKQFLLLQFPELWI